jgi:N6-L-threonylcarbamoyladenine synthase
MRILGIESSCDETAVSLVEEGHRILSEVLSSQIPIHQPYGGVFPELASRSHCDVLIPLIEECLQKANSKAEDVNAIAVTYGPGLIGSLLMGLNAAKTLAWSWKKPLIGVNHVEAHLYAAMMGHKELLFPALGLVISGAHTFIIRIEDIGRYQCLGTTVDDALGEAFDKVAALLGLSYPGGPAIETLAKEGDPKAFTFKAGQIKHLPLHFSFSGLKTQLLYATCGKQLSHAEKADLAASFQETAFQDLSIKLQKALDLFPCRAIYLGGGVSANCTLRERFRSFSLPLFWPPLNLSIDNASMIAGLGYHRLLKKPEGDRYDLAPHSRIPLSAWTSIN